MKKIIVLSADLTAFLLAVLAPRLTSLMMKNLGECFFAKRGIICPACGGTRAVHSFFTGRFLDAITYNAAFFCAILYGILLLALWNLHTFLKSRRALKALRLAVHPVTLLSLHGLFLVYGVGRALIG